MGIAERAPKARTVAVAVAAVALGATLVSTASADEVAGDIAGTVVDVGQGACGAGWSGGAAGRLSFALKNTASVVEEIQIQGDDSKKIFLDIEDLGMGATRAVTVTLPAGGYRFLCMAADGSPNAGPTWKLAGDYAGPTTPGILPTSEGDFAGPVNAYSGWVVGQLAQLKADVATLAARISAGRLSSARAAWMTAHRQYLLLGAAYGAFGDLGDAIDAPTTPGVAPLSDPDLTGFPKLEAMLWSAQPVAPANAVDQARRQVQADVKKVRKARKHPHRATKLRKAEKQLSAARKRLAGARAEVKQAKGRIATYLRENAAPVVAQLGSDVGTLASTFNSPAQPSNTDMGLRAHEILEDALRFELTGRDDAGAHLTLFDIHTMVDATRDVMAPLRGLLAQRDADLAATDAWLGRLQAYVDTFHDPVTNTWTPYGDLSVSQQRTLEATLSQTLEYLSEIAVVLDPVQAGPA